MSSVTLYFTILKGDPGFKPHRLLQISFPTVYDIVSNEIKKTCTYAYNRIHHDRRKEEI